jgi:hypothetical protein
LAALGHATAIHAPNSPGLPLSPRGDEGNSSNSSNSSARIVNGGLDSIASALTASIVSLTHNAQLSNAHAHAHVHSDNSLGTIPCATYEPSIEWMCEFCVQPLGLSSDRSGTHTTTEALGSSRLTLFEKAMVIMFRTKNSAGLTLGEIILHHTEADRASKHIFSDQDCCKSAFFEAVYTWLACAIVFSDSALQGDVSTCDSYSFSRSIAHSVTDLQLLFDAYDVNERTVEYNEEHGALLYLHHAFAYVHNMASSRASEARSGASSSSTCAQGYLIPVTCGHSGWPDTRAMAALTACLGRAGFPVPAPELAEHRFSALFQR